jgi:UDP-glucose:(heptosyl)LPS alpha-1,3-glucosyltransferase
MLCAASNGVAAELREQFPAVSEIVRVIPNGVDSAVFRPDPVARAEFRSELGLDDLVPVAVFVGGDWFRKGLQHAVEALSDAPEWHLVVAGGGDPEPLLERARTTGAAARLHFLGRRLDTPRIYAAADAFVFPTSYEAFPLVSLEAAASGLPLLISRVNGAEDLLHEGGNGWFITRDGHDIGARLNQLLGDPERSRAMGRAARDSASEYTWESMANQYAELYAELTRHGGRRD